MIRNTNEQLDKNVSVQRIATLDFVRGLAIFLMTFFHSFFHVFKIQLFIDDPKIVFQYKPIFVPFLLVLIYLGTWNSLFLLVSCIVNTLGMVKGAYSGSNVGLIYIKKIITGIWLLICDYFCDALLYNGYLGQSVVTGQWATINHFLYPF